MGKADRYLIAYGGIILLSGIFMLFLSIASLIKFIDPTPLLRHPDLLIYASLVVGALDLLCGILLALSKGGVTRVEEEGPLKRSIGSTEVGKREGG